HRRRTVHCRSHRPGCAGQPPPEPADALANGSGRHRGPRPGDKRRILEHLPEQTKLGEAAQSFNLVVDHTHGFRPDNPTPSIRPVPRRHRTDAASTRYPTNPPAPGKPARSEPKNSLKSTWSSPLLLPNQPRLLDSGADRILPPAGAG